MEKRKTIGGGLTAFVTTNVSPGTAHLVTPPPNRSDFDTADAYDRAYIEWQRSLVTIRGFDTEDSRHSESDPEGEA